MKNDRLSPDIGENAVATTPLSSPPSASIAPIRIPKVAELPGSAQPIPEPKHATLAECTSCRISPVDFVPGKGIHVFRPVGTGSSVFHRYS